MKITGLPKLFDPAITGVEINRVYVSRADYDYMQAQQNAPMFYIENMQHRGDCCIWWRPEGKGYTRNLDEAWKVTEEEARKICRSRPEQDVMRAADLVDAEAARHLGR